MFKAVATGDLIIVSMGIALGVYLENKLGLYEKAKAPFRWLVSAFAWIKSKF